MRNKLLGLTAALLASTMLTPANATVNVEAEVYKDKDVTVTETITITKTVFIQAEYIATLDRAAEALAIHNVTNTENTVTRSPLDGEGDDGIDREATIQQSVGPANPALGLGNSGVVGVNQDVGDNTNQGIVVAVGVTEEGDTVADAQASVEQSNTFNTVNWPGPDQLDVLADPITVTAVIFGGVSNNHGIALVNQNAGNNNNQTNAVAAAVGLNLVGGEGAVALAEADLGQLNSDNTVSELNTQKSASIGRSVIGNNGIVGVNQAVGSNSNQANIVAISATPLP